MVLATYSLNSFTDNQWHYAKARGKWAKTDPIDARLIAEFARDLEPELRPLPDAETQALAALCQRRNQSL